MYQILKSWIGNFMYFVFGLCFYDGCVVSGNTNLTDVKCGNVFITVSSIDGSLIELNWESNNCGSNDTHPELIALYNGDIRQKIKDNIFMYDEVKTIDHPGGFFRTKIAFNSSTIPGEWIYNSTIPVNLGSYSLPYWIVSFSNSNQIIDIQSLKLQPSWMYENRKEIESKRLGNLMIPGTHDSGSYGNLRLFEDYVLTQDMSIFDQLVYGIRYFDFRAAYHQDERFWINHDFVKIRPMQKVYDQIKQFLEKSPWEVIIVDFHRFPFPTVWSSQLHEKFINYTLEELGKYAYSKDGSESLYGPVIGDIWKAKKNIIFAYGEKTFADKHPELWEPIPQVWANTISVDDLKKYLDNAIENDKEYSTFKAIMGELTPRSIDVFTGTHTLRQLANDVNSKLTKWVRDEWYNEVNIVTSDFFLGNNLIEIAIDINRNSR